MTFISDHTDNDDSDDDSDDDDGDDEKSNVAHPNIQGSSSHHFSPQVSQSHEILNDYKNREIITNISGYIQPDEPGYEQISENWPRIRDQINRGNRMHVYNQISPNDNYNENLNRFLVAIHGDQTQMYRLQIQVGFLAYNHSTNEYRYFYPSYNTNLLDAREFDSIRLITNTADLQRMLEIIDAVDIVEVCRQQRPSSKWMIVRVINFTVRTFILNDNPIRGLDVPLPDYIKNNPYIISLDKNPNTGELYKDSLCFWRAAVCHQNNINMYTTRQALSLLQSWPGIYGEFPDIDLSKIKNQRQWLRDNYQGIYMHQLDDVEKMLQTCVAVYSLLPDRSVVNVRRSSHEYPTTMNLHLYENHFSYITDLNGLTNTFQCSECGKLFDKCHKLTRHRSKGCKGAINRVYPGGYYKSTPTIFEALNSHQINIDRMYYPFFATYDFESYSPDGKIQRILSVSIDSNVPLFDKPVCYIAGEDAQNEQDIVNKMIKYLLKISKRASKIVLKMLPMEEIEQLDLEENDPLLDKRIVSWSNQLPVVGFNSSKFDIPLMRRLLAKAIHKDTESVIIQGNRYSLISTHELAFLDIRNYLAPDTNYSSFLKAYNTETRKGFWPYEYVTSVSQLKEKNLPPRTAFYSTLKQEELSQENYDELLDVWRANGMKTLRDLLVWYNNLGNYSNNLIYLTIFTISNVSILHKEKIRTYFRCEPIHTST